MGSEMCIRDSACPVDIVTSHVNLDMLHVEMNKTHFDIIMLIVDITYLACQGQRYANTST